MSSCLSPLLVPATFVQTSAKCWCAWPAWLNISIMKAVSSARLALLGSFLRNSSPDGISSGGSTTSTPPAIKCCRKYSTVGSLIVLNTTSVSAAPILSHCFVITFLKFWIVSKSAVLVSWWIKMDRVSKMLLILSWYCSASATFCAPCLWPFLFLFFHYLYHWIRFLCHSCWCTGIEPKEGGNLVGHSKTRFKLMILAGTATYIGHAPHLDGVPWWIFYSQPNRNAAFTIDDWFLCTGVELRVQIKGKSPAGTCSWCPACAAVGRNLVESPEKT